MYRELARAVGELWRTIGDAFSPYRPELHYMRGPGPKCRVKHQARSGCSEELAGHDSIQWNAKLALKGALNAGAHLPGSRACYRVVAHLPTPSFMSFA
jgi:hypothetical protein